jgi:hypothetical protein
MQQPLLQSGGLPSYLFFSGSGTIIPVYEERRKSLESQLAQTSGKDSRIIE